MVLYQAETKFWHKKRYNSGTNCKLDLFNINAYIKFGEHMYSCSQDIELKQNFGVNKGP